jgi:hypothetical protein
MATENPLDGRVTQLEIRMAVAESDIKNVRVDITAIKDDTRWLRRAFTGAIITAIVGGAIGIIFALVNYVVIK